MSTSFSRLGGPALLLLLGVAGCAEDLFERPGTWRPLGVNDSNLRAMVADPRDLTRGVSAVNERGAAGSNAATRLLTEQRRPLLAAPSSTVGGGSASPQDSPLAGLGVAAGSGGGGAAR